MKIVIGSIEISNNINTITDELRKQGHEVISIAENKNTFYNNKYTYDPYDLIFDYHFPKYRYSQNNLIFLLKKGLRVLDKISFRVLRKITVIKIIKSNDLYISIWEGLLINDSDLKLWKKHNKKIITLFVGSDIRDYNSFMKKYNISTESLNLPTTFYKTESNRLHRKVNKVKLHEKYSNAIFSVPDQSDLLKRPYYHKQLPIDVAGFKVNVSERKKPLIIHAPSHPTLKGTNVIKQVIERLRNDGVEFEFELLTKVPHKIIKEILTNSDILIDQIVTHGPGKLGIEAMASGCVVATRFLEESPECFRPPVYHIDAENIYDKLKELIENSTLRIELANKGYEYVKENNNVSKIVTDMLNKALYNDENEYDYYPLKSTLLNEK